MPTTKPRNLPWAKEALQLSPSLIYQGRLNEFDRLLPELTSGRLGLQRTIELFATTFPPRLQPGIAGAGSLAELEKLRGKGIAVLIAQCPQRDHTFQDHGACPTSQYVDLLIETSGVPTLLLDHSFHCTKCNDECMCDFDRVDQHWRELAKRRRNASCLGLLAAVTAGFELDVTSISLVGAIVSRGLTDHDLSHALGRDSVRVARGMHTTPMFNLLHPSRQEPSQKRSASLLKLLYIMTVPFHQQDVHWLEGAELRSDTGVGELYTQFITHNTVKGRHFMQIAESGDWIAPVMLTQAQVKEAGRLHRQKPEGTKLCGWFAANCAAGVLYIFTARTVKLQLPTYLV
ncbi:hypothetical protein ABBQ38_010973 [Trebouxia sp. C0009 RCD-2024]